MVNQKKLALESAAPLNFTVMLSLIVQLPTTLLSSSLSLLSKQAAVFRDKKNREKNMYAIGSVSN